MFLPFPWIPYPSHRFLSFLLVLHLRNCASPNLENKSCVASHVVYMFRASRHTPYPLDPALALLFPMVFNRRY